MLDRVIVSELLDVVDVAVMRVALVNSIESEETSSSSIEEDTPHVH